jgi:hypothetical protein
MPDDDSIWLNVDPDDVTFGPMTLHYVGHVPKRPAQSHTIMWLGEFWPPEYDSMKGDTWNGVYYRERPAWAKDAQ